jgi:putative ABC transport system permease protein
MIKSFFKIAVRNLTRNKIHSLINIIGLSAGMAVAMLTGLWIWDECSYEKYNPNYDHIAQVMQTGTLNGEGYTYGSMPLPLAAELRTTYGSSFRHVILSWWVRDHILSAGDKKFTEKGKFMEPEAPEMLSLKMEKGSRAGLNDPSSILLSASVAKALFGDTDPMERRVKIDDKMEVKVTGVYEDLPENSRFNDVMFIAPWKLHAAQDAVVKDYAGNWAYDATEIYVQMADHADIRTVSAKIKNSTLDKLKDNKEAAAYKPIVFLQPMSRWHLYSEFKNGVNTGGRIQFVWLLGIIGVFVLLLACINFMNLSTARSERRAKEVGIRKTMGSRRGKLIVQFFGESLLGAAFAFVLSLFLVGWVLPFFNEMADKKMTLPWASPLFWLMSIVFILFTGIIAGSYPALYLSSFQPVKVLRGSFRVGRLATIPRKALVVLQFTVSIALIIGTLVVLRQVRFAKDRPVGYDRNGLITIQMTTPGFFSQAATLRNDLLRTGAVAEMAESSSPATWVWQNLGGFNWPGKDPSAQAEFGIVSVSPEYGRTVGWQFAAGRDFSGDFPTDSSGMILNEAAIKYMGLKKAVGERVTQGQLNFQVIGVIRDMLMESPYESVKPTIYYIGKSDAANFLFIKINPAVSAGTALDMIRTVFQKHIPSAPFDYKFVDAEYAKKFAGEERIGRLAGAFAFLAILISCLGIFGMATFMAEQRIKEIGIRKVLGASVFNIWRLLSKDFVVLVIIALFIAIPVAYTFMYNWLQNYEYHPGIPWWIFAAAGAGALLITLLTVSFQALKAAVANPVKSLKTD